MPPKPPRLVTTLVQRPLTARPSFETQVATAAAVGGIAGATIVLGRQAITDLPTVLIALVGLALLWRFKSRLKEPLAVLAAGAAGLALHGI